MQEGKHPTLVVEAPRFSCILKRKLASYLINW